MRVRAFSTRSPADTVKLRPCFECSKDTRSTIVNNVCCKGHTAVESTVIQPSAGQAILTPGEGHHHCEHDNRCDNHLVEAILCEQAAGFRDAAAARELLTRDVRDARTELSTTVNTGFTAAALASCKIDDACGTGVEGGGGCCQRSASHGVPDRRSPSFSAVSSEPDAGVPACSSSPVSELLLLRDQGKDRGG